MAGELNVVVLISGSGTNLQALIDAFAAASSSTQAEQGPKGRISLVLSNRKAAYGLQRAADAGLRTTVFSLASYAKAHPGSSREEYDLALADEVLKGRPDLVVLAGFMHILSAGFLDRLKDGEGRSVPIINLHPALPGKFDGANAIRRAWEAGPSGSGEVTETGIMVHEVVPEVDRGEPVLVRTVPLRADESLEALEARMHEVEHEIIVEGTKEMLRRVSAKKEGQQKPSA